MNYSFQTRSGLCVNSEHSQVVNVTLDEVTAIFVTSGVGFDKFNLNLFGNIQFFGNCSMRAIRSSYNGIFRDTPNNLYASEQWNKDYSDAQFCRMRMLAEEWMLEDGWTLPEDWLIYIGEELTQHFLEYFDKYCHEERFLPKEPLEVTEIALDAEMKVAERCSKDKVKKRAGAPRLDGTTPARGNGWGAASDPRSGRIVGMVPLEDPENLDCWVFLLTKILWLYLNCNCIIHDRACKLLQLLQVTRPRAG